MIRVEGAVLAHVAQYVELIAVVMTGGALDNEYRLIQFHAHWGNTAGAKGSEHTVNGKLYDAEVQILIY